MINISVSPCVSVIHFDAISGYVKHFVLDVHSNYRSAKMQWNVAYETFSVSVYLRRDKLYKIFVFSVFPIAYKGCITVNKDLVSSVIHMLCFY